MKILLFIAALAVGLPAEEVVKTDGQVIEGKVLSRQDGEAIRIEDAQGKVWEIEWNDIRKVGGQRLGDPGLPMPKLDAHFSDQDWFAYWALGFGGLSYPSAWQGALESWGTRQMSLSLDMLGFYWPVNGRKTLLGFVVNGFGDAWLSRSGLRMANFNQYVYGFSAWQSLQGRLGDGWFVRADLGPAVSLLSTNDMTSGGLSVSRAVGFGATLGVGFLFGNNSENRFAPSLYYSPRYVEGELYQSYGGQAGILW